MSSPSVAPDAASALEGKSVGRYLLRFLVASGGMASVYLAQLGGHAGFEKWVALKRIHPNLVTDPRFVSMFLDEARVTARIQHPNVCSVIDFGEDGGAPYLVMEYLHGESLSQVARRGQEAKDLPTWLVARIVADAARGLHAAHELRDDHAELLGVVHRDVSPQNIAVLYDGATKVLDFGVAKARGRIESTLTGEVKGKSAYLAPEQINEQAAVDRRADIWALGVVLWELLAVRRLFRGDNDAATMHRVLTAPIPLPSATRKDVAPALDAIVMRALERSIEARWPSAAALADALEEWLYASGKPAGPRQVSAWMHDHFADKKAMRDAMLRSGALPGAIPTIELDSKPSKSGVVPTTDPSTVVPPAPERRPLAWAVALGIAIAIGAGGIGLWIGSSGGRGEPSGLAGAPTIGVGDPTTATPPDPPPDDARSGQPDAGHSAEADAAAARTSDPDESVRRERPTTDRRERPPGQLNLLAVPPAEVFEGSRSLGRTPIIELELGAGRHRLILRPIGGGEERRTDVVIRSGELTRVSLR